MSQLIGEKSIVAFEIGSFWKESTQLKEIPIWIAGQLANPIDFVVYLPSFTSKINQDVLRLRSQSFGKPANFEGVADYEVCDIPWCENRVFDFDISICMAHCYFFENESSGELISVHWDPRHELGRSKSILTACVSRRELAQLLEQVLVSLE